MGKNARGERDGTGPHKESYQKRVGGVGKRRAAGLPCPVSRETKAKGL